MKTPILLAVMLAPALSFAGPRTSTNYNVPADTTDGGGKRATSANYTNDGSAGGVTGISTVAAPVETAKHGYVGQLFDVTGLGVSGASNVNETATLQLAAAQLLDDASQLAVSANVVTWGVVSGPITGISLAGLATAGTAYQNTAATVQGAFGGFTGTLNLSVLDSIADNFGSYAGDSLGDDWQVQYFGLNNPLAAPTADPDGDGQNNLFEFTAGLVPNNAQSRFALKVAAVPGQPTQQRIIFSPLVSGRTYTVNVRPDLTTGTWTTLTGTTQSDAGPERTVTDTSAKGTERFYQVKISKP